MGGRRGRFSSSIRRREKRRREVPRASASAAPARCMVAPRTVTRASESAERPKGCTKDKKPRMCRGGCRSRVPGPVPYLGVANRPRPRSRDVQMTPRVHTTSSPSHWLQASGHWDAACSTGCSPSTVGNPTGLSADPWWPKPGSPGVLQCPALGARRRDCLRPRGGGDRGRPGSGKSGAKGCPTSAIMPGPVVSAVVLPSASSAPSPVLPRACDRAERQTGGRVVRRAPEGGVRSCR